MVAKQFSDEELTAFLDGELEESRAQEITSRLASDEALSKRLERLSFPLEALQLAADKMLDEAPEYVEPKPAVQSSAFGGYVRYAAVLVAGLAVGYLVHWAQIEQEPEEWISAVASYQALYVEETLANANQPVSVADGVLTSFGQSENVPVIEMKDLPALSFKRAQILGFKNNPLLQMAYTSADGSPIALCVTRVNEADRTPRKGVYDGLPAYDWVRNGKGFILIGEMDASEMKSVVDQLERILG